jgi:hypothetical protein
LGKEVEWRHASTCLRAANARNSSLECAVAITA